MKKTVANIQLQIEVPDDGDLSDALWELEDAVKGIDDYYDWKLTSVVLSY
tara:strand:- start:676 stop:825 length:150 start_codon:yes stop_codon:yes gene_type:complete